LVSSRLVDGFPDPVRFAIVVLLLSYLPGECLRRWLGRPLEGTAYQRVSAALFLGFAWQGIVAWFCSRIGLSFSAYAATVQIAWFVLFGLFLVAGRKERAAPAAAARPGSNSWIVFVIAASVAAVVYVTPHAFNMVGEDYGHLGSMRSIIANDAMITHGVLAPVSAPASGEGAGMHLGMFHSVLAALTRIADVSLFAMWRWLAIVLAVATVLAFATFGRILLPSFAYWIVALTLFIIFQIGLGADFPAGIGYPELFSVLFSWLLFGLVIEYGRAPAYRTLLAFAVVLLGGSFLHHLVLVHFGLMLLAFLLLRRAFPVGGRALTRVVLVSVVCAAWVMLWRISVLNGAGTDVESLLPPVLYFLRTGDRYFIENPISVVSRNGLLFLAGVALVPGLLLIRRHQRFAWMSLALSLPALFVVLNPWMVPFVHDRGFGLPSAAWLNIPIAVISALVLGSLITWARQGRITRKVIAVVLLLIWGQLFLSDMRSWAGSVRTARAGRAAIPLGDRWRGLIDFIDKRVPPGSTILSDAATSNVIAAHCAVDVVAVPAHRIPSDGSPISRLRAVGNVLSPHTTQLEAEAVIREYNVDYVVLNGAMRGAYDWESGGWDPLAMEIVANKLGSFSRMLKPVYEEASSIVYEASRNNPPSDYTWFPELPYSKKPMVAFGHCDMKSENNGPRVSGAVVVPAEVLAGENVELFLRYRRDTNEQSALPLMVRVRLEQVDYFDSQKSWPGDRIARVLDEKRDGLVRYDVSHRPFDGLYTPDTWPIGLDIYEALTIQLPSNLREGTYVVEFMMDYGIEVSHTSLWDLLHNDDFFAGTACAEIEVRHFVTR